MSITLNSHFEMAPFEPDDSARAAACVDNILDEAGVFADQNDVIIDEEGRLVFDVEHHPDFDPEVAKIVCENINALIVIVRNRVDSSLVGQRPRSISFGCNWEKKFQDEDDYDSSLESWHVDTDGSAVFLAYGDVARIECVTGSVEVKGRKDTFVQAKTAQALRKKLVESTAIPNNCPVVLNNETIHRKGRNVKSGLRFAVKMLYS